MIIDLSKSQLFTQHPDIRFAKRYGVPEGTWTELWRRYKLLDYTSKDLQDYFFAKHARHLHFDAARRWIQRTEIYSITHPKMIKGVTHVNSTIFGEFEQFVMDELTKQLLNGATTDSRIII